MQGNMKSCNGMQDKVVEYLDGRIRPAERRAVEEHFSSCAECRVRAEQFRALWNALDDLPVLSPSPAFDASLRARIAAEPSPRHFWSSWIWLPSPRLAFAVTALVVMSVWLSSMPRGTTDRTTAEAAATQSSADSEFRMIRDLPVLENYDVISKFDALTELPMPQASAGEATKENR